MMKKNLRKFKIQIRNIKFTSRAIEFSGGRNAPIWFERKLISSDFNTFPPTVHDIEVFSNIFINFRLISWFFISPATWKIVINCSYRADFHSKCTAREFILLKFSIFYDSSTCKCDDGKCVKALVGKQKITEHAIASCATLLCQLK